MKLIFFILIFVLGLALIGFGITLWFVIPNIVKQKVSDLLPLKHYTVVYDQWKNTTMPVYMEFWFFNITNMLEVENGGKPNVTEIGPYAYREYRIKENITFYDNGTVSYKQRRVFYFDRSKSNGSDDDIFTTINIPMVVLGDKIRYGGILVKIIDFIVEHLHNENVLMNVSVKNLTWGYVDPVLEMVASFAKLVHIKIDPMIGLFYKKNNTDDGEYLVDSGMLSLTDFLGIQKWKYAANLSNWNSDVANMINGTDGAMFAPFLDSLPPDQPLYVFVSDLCRSIYATYSSSSIIRGIPARTYRPPYSVFANSSENPYNHGFCVGGVCLGSGVLNLSSCIEGMPIVMSQPHLYQAAEKYQNDINGLHPSPDCITSLSLEPTTGLPLDLQKKLQINIAVTAVPKFDHMDRLRSMFVPVMWLNESVYIDEANAALITQMLIVPQRAAYGSSIAMMALGVVVMVAIVLFVLVRGRHGRKYKIINAGDSE